MKTDHQTELNEDGRRLLRLLVARLPQVKKEDPRTFITYKQVHDALGLQQHGPTFGASLKTQGLSNLADWTALTGKPGISGLIVDGASRMPGAGYFSLFNRQSEDYAWWIGEIEKSQNFDWSPHLVQKTDPPAATEWHDDELRSAVQLYLEMQNLARAGKPVVKKRYYEELSARYGRSAKAFEYRMQNISYVLTLMGRDWISGLKPAANVGVNIAARIEQFIHELEQQPYSPAVAFEIVVREGRGKRIARPTGQRSPRSTPRTVVQFERDPAVKTWVLDEAEGVCECCEQPAPFRNTDDQPFLEVHHVRKLAEGGSDTITNAVALCPNCHRALHYGMRAKELVQGLYLRVGRLVRE